MVTSEHPREILLFVLFGMSQDFLINLIKTNANRSRTGGKAQIVSYRQPNVIQQPVVYSRKGPKLMKPVVLMDHIPLPFKSILINYDKIKI